MKDYLVLLMIIFFQIVNMAGCCRRHQSGNDVVGPSADLLASDLPTLRDVLAYGLFLKESLLKRSNEIALRELSKQVCADLKQVWARANHTLMAPDVVYLDQNVENKFIDDWNLMRLVKNEKLNKKKEATWRAKLDKLFNILVCQCPFLGCSEVDCLGCADSVHLA